MFVEHKEQGEPQPVKVGTLKISELIRRGKPIVGDRERPVFEFCALGCAWAGLHGKMLESDDLVRMMMALPKLEWQERIAVTLGFTPELGNEINKLHCRLIPALVIAETLESRGL